MHRAHGLHLINGCERTLVVPKRPRGKMTNTTSYYALSTTLGLSPSRRPTRCVCVLSAKKRCKSGPNSDLPDDKAQSLSITPHSLDQKRVQRNSQRKPLRQHQKTKTLTVEPSQLALNSNSPHSHNLHNVDA